VADQNEFTSHPEIVHQWVDLFFQAAGASHAQAGRRVSY